MRYQVTGVNEIGDVDHGLINANDEHDAALRFIDLYSCLSPYGYDYITVELTDGSGKKMFDQLMQEVGNEPGKD